MSAADAMTDVIRIRIEPEKKTALAELYRSRGTNLSQAARDFFDTELESAESPLDRFDAIMAAADEKLDAYEAPEPTIEDIVAYVEKVREVRSRDLVA
ncbi:hypothetical protein [Adlercreutzia sp. ZJ473]|uniref:hypothetical protein n=1 Tax=Adlercreutzia sp. ZJ473 TaxID=2722822 RepID=UPI001554E06B|nr:hypothetical protein [Adlercreutzia sp. ZJ473]